MASLETLDHSILQSQIVPIENDPMFPPPKNPSSRRTPSFSSLSSLSSCPSSLQSSYFPDNSPLGSPTPIRLSGVPFSWEKLPGIPKKQPAVVRPQKKKESSSLSPRILPLIPPPTTTYTTPPTSKRFNCEEKKMKNVSARESTFQSDPFLAALFECSKDDDDDENLRRQISSSRKYFFDSNSKVSRSISDRFGLVNLYASCKRTCTVSESIVYLPRSTRSSYDHLINHRSR